MRPVFIIGRNGQDGFYLSKRFLESGYFVVGLKHTINVKKPILVRSKFDDKIFQINLNLYSVNQLKKTIYDFDPQMIFHLGAIYYPSNLSSPDLAFFREQFNCNYKINENILNILVEYKKSTKYIYAASSRMYSKSYKDTKITLITKPEPQDFYGQTKLKSWNLIKRYRSLYDLDASAAILFNHDSPKREQGYLSSDIANGIYRLVKFGESIKLRNLNSRLDISDARDIVAGLYSMATKSYGQDFIFASGKLISVYEILNNSMTKLGLKAQDAILDSQLIESNKIQPGIFGDITATRKLLDWHPTIDSTQTIIDIYNNFNK
jgi:GDPmannose 4,6-dehydratase